MSKQKRYESKEQIEKKIDRLHAKKARLIVKCVELDQELKERRQCPGYNVTTHQLEKELLRLERTVRNIDDKHLPRMKRTMAAFLTVPMKELCGEDCGVVVER
jgi:phage shock protein A